MRCCSGKKLQARESKPELEERRVTSSNQEYLDFMAWQTGVAEEIRKDSQPRTASGSLNPRNDALQFLDRSYHTLVDSYTGAIGEEGRFGSWKTYEPTAFQTLKINIARATTAKIHLMMHRKSGYIGIMKVIPSIKNAEARGEFNALSVGKASPFIIRLLDGFILDNFFIFLEYAPFRTLDHLTQVVKGLGADNSRLYALEIACAIEFLHSKQIMHRDIKPENVFILVSGHVALGDLGSSIQMDGTTQTNRRCGTYVTRPPEVWRGVNYTTAVDIWQFGMSLYNIISNTWPILHPNKDVQVESVNRGKIMYGQSFDRTSSDLIGRMLQVDPGNRPTARQILKHEYFDDLTEPYSPAFTPHELIEMMNLGDEVKLIRELVAQIS